MLFRASSTFQDLSVWRTWAFCLGLWIPLATLAAETPDFPPLSVPLNCATAESLALARDPILAEQELEVDKAREKLRDVEMQAILPKFEVTTGMGPAPGLRNDGDTTSLHIYNPTLNEPGGTNSPAPGTTGYLGSSVYQVQKEYDFSEWGPFFGVEAEVIQPLNIARFRAGKRASERQIDVSAADFQKQRLDVSEQAQALYYQRVFALTMRGVLDSAKRNLDDAQKKLSDQLDKGTEGVSQTDLLQLKAGRFGLDQGLNEAVMGVSRTDLGLRFLLAWSDSGDIPLADSVLTVRPEVVPSLDSLKFFTLRDHPDLKKLQNGLAAREELLKVAQGELGPDIFLFGSFTYTKAWSSDRQSEESNNPFEVDPLNQLTGLAGLGIKLQLNFWERYQDYRKARLDLRQLQRTEVYAARGLLIQVEDAYAQLLKSRADIDEAQNSMRAAQAWLKGVAMKYDLDPSTSKDLIAPYKQSLTAQRDYYQAILDYNLAVARLFKAVGWTLPDYFHSLTGDKAGG